MTEKINLAPSETVDPTTNRPLVPQLSQGEIIPQREQALDQIQKLVQFRRSTASLPSASVPKELVDFITKKQQNPTFPEPLFKQYFLPLFAGIAPNDHPVSYETWQFKVAGNDTTAVDVVNEKGEVLFTVPALLEHAGVVKNVSGRSMTIIERQYNRMKEISATDSQNMLSTALTDLHIPKDKPKEMFDNVRIWNDIFRFYGMDDLINPLFPESAEAPPKTNDQRQETGKSDIASGGLEFD